MERDAATEKSLRVLAIVPSPACFGLQYLTLAFFGNAPPWLQSHFLTTRWTDGEFDSRLDALGIPRTSTWLGMFSRKLDRANRSMTWACLKKLPSSWRDFLLLYGSFKPDVIYVANHHEIILLWPLLVWLRAKVVCHMHDPPPALPFQKRSFAVWRRAVGRFLFVSDSVRRRTEQLGPLRETDVVVHNGVNVGAVPSPRGRSSRFARQFEWPDDSVVFGITGQVTESKGHEDFIEAAAIAHRANDKTRFVIGGRGPAEYTQRLEDMIVRRGMANTISFCGWLQSASEFYEGIDVLVLASRHDEGFGLVVAEAAERCVPVIATASGGAVEVIVADETGFLIDKQNPPQMAATMVRMAGDERLRRKMAAAARRRVEEEFDLIVQADRFAQALRAKPQHS